MIKKLKDTFSLTDQGVRSVLIGILTSTLHNISILVPTILLFVVGFRFDFPLPERNP